MKVEMKQIGFAKNRIRSWTICDSFQASCMGFFVLMNFESFKERLKKNKNPKSETKHTRATRYSEYGMNLDKCMYVDDKDVVWTSVHLEKKKLETT